jgi:hypothetical protein
MVSAMVADHPHRVTEVAFTGRTVGDSMPSWIPEVP